MKPIKSATVPFVFFIWFLARTSLAAEINELAVLKGTGTPVNCLALSADGSRLAVAVSGWKIDKNNKIVTIPGETIVWDVDAKHQICDFKNPTADFTYLWLSADGKTAVTADHGETNLGYNEQFPIMVAGKRGYQQWDATTGKTMGSLIAPQRLSQFTAAAVSPDGRYLAAIWNEQEISPTPPLKPYIAGEIRVWDLHERKVKWTLPGSSHTGKLVWVDALAFAPDGGRLAVYRSFGGPSSEAALAPPDRRDTAFKPLRLLTLEAGKFVPTVTVLERAGIALPQKLEWPTDGRTLVVRDERSFQTVDPTTGRNKEVFKIPFPPFPTAASSSESAPPNRSSSASAKLPNGLRLPPRPAANHFANPDTTADDVPANYREPETTLSADGSRFATYFIYDREGKRVRENRVGIWDVGSRRLLGVLRLPDEEYSPNGLKKPQHWKNDARVRTNKIALSGDGRRIAVSDSVGTVRIYDTTALSGPEDTRAVTATNAASADVATIRSGYERSVQLAHNQLLDRFDKQIDLLERSTNKGGDFPAPTTAAELKKERESFEKENLVPWSKPMWKPVTDYFNLIAAARATAHTALGGGELPADMKDLLDKQVIARWRHQPHNRVITFYSSGRFGDPEGENTWSFLAGKLTLRWKDKRAPGGFFVDTCTLALDGQSYSGTNQNNVEVSGTYLLKGQ